MSLDGRHRGRPLRWDGSVQRAAGIKSVSASVPADVDQGAAEFQSVAEAPDWDRAAAWVAVVAVRASSSVSNSRPETNDNNCGCLRRSVLDQHDVQPPRAVRA